MKKRNVTATIIIILLLVLTGCTAKPKATPEQEQAVSRAEVVLVEVGRPISKGALLLWLQQENMPNDLILYAIDNIEINWNENARLAAVYLIDNLGSLTRTELIGTLEMQMFTPEEAKYAADEVGL